MRSRLLVLVALGMLAGGCGGNDQPPPTAGAAPPSAGSAGGVDKACSGGLTGQEPGVVRITCNGNATLKIQVGDVTKELHGGVCHTTGPAWTAAVGVIIDISGSHGDYTGSPVDSIVVNDTSTAGKGTIQATIGGKDYYDLGNATMTISADRKSAHLEGTGHQFSDAPKAKIVVDVTC